MTSLRQAPRSAVALRQDHLAVRNSLQLRRKGAGRGNACRSRAITPSKRCGCVDRCEGSFKL